MNASEELTALLQASQKALILTDAAGSILVYNKAARDLFGALPDGARGSSIVCLLPDKDRRMYLNYLAVCRSQRGVPEPFGPVTLSMRGSDREPGRFRTKITPMEDADGRLFVGEFEPEISGPVRPAGPSLAFVPPGPSQERSVVDCAACLRTQSIAHNRALTAVGNNFLALISHEVRTPLAVIHSSADLLSHHYEQMTPDQRDRRLEKIRVQVRHLSEMMEDIAFFQTVRQERFVASRLRTEQLVDDAIGETLERLGVWREIRVQMTRPSEECLVMPERLVRRIVNSMLRNAVLYSPEDTPVFVRIGGDHRKLEIRFRNEGRIPDEIEKNLFQPFVRGSRSGICGSGLGLAIAAQAAELCQGRVRLVDAGPPVCFSVGLPIHRSMVAVENVPVPVPRRIR